MASSSHCNGLSFGWLKLPQVTSLRHVVWFYLQPASGERCVQLVIRSTPIDPSTTACSWRHAAYWECCWPADAQSCICPWCTPASVQGRPCWFVKSTSLLAVARIGKFMHSLATTCAHMRMATVSKTQAETHLILVRAKTLPTVMSGTTALVVLLSNQTQIVYGKGFFFAFSALRCWR